MVQNELQTFQQGQKGTCQNHGQSAESMYVNTFETNSEMMTQNRSQQGPLFGQVQMIKRPPNAPANLGLPVNNTGLGNALNNNWEQSIHTTVDLASQTGWPQGDNQGGSYSPVLNVQPTNGSSFQPGRLV